MKTFPAIRAEGQEWAGHFLDMVYPRVCAHCGRQADATRFLCWECLADIRYVQPPFCSHCGDPVPGHIDHEYTCAFCARRKPAFDSARSAVRYEAAVGVSLRSIKYNAATWLVPDMTALLLTCCATYYSLLTFDAVCYVPLHAVKERERGFNQASLLAQGVARARRWPLLKQGLRRIKDTGSQTHLTAAQRTSNVAGVFQVPKTKVKAVRHRRLLLIDDVMTTGATVNECAKMLKQAGAVTVHVLTVARG